MRVEASEHPADGVLQEIGVAHRLHVMLANDAEHFAEQAQLLHRQFEAGRSHWRAVGSFRVGAVAQYQEGAKKPSDNQGRPS